MAHIIEFAPLFAYADTPDLHHVTGVWNAAEATERLAAQRGHTYHRPAVGGTTQAEVDAALASTDALILAPSVAGPAGMLLPADGEESGRIIGHRLLDRLSAERPDLHVVFISHFLVGHGVTHRNSKPHTWGLRSLEAHLRGGRNPWTILRATWLSTVHDESYQTRLSQDPYTDGLSSTTAIADAALTAIENPRAAVGRTAAVFNLSIPEVGRTDLVRQFEALEPDFEYEVSRQPVDA
ncbi:hypothetical protein [Frankia tisae]|uniref:hypothetical protein n=1 Tax=Frankia tisae TaxID=2950104 RepID=UPI0021BEAE4D|nr:hypothetical protein [Frankia tisae]